MFKCTGRCSECGRCRNIFPDQVERNVYFPEGFIEKVQEKNNNKVKPAHSYGIAFDIGTTTIAGGLFNLMTGEKLETAGSINPQRNFGADVISRISYCYGSDEKRRNLRRPLLNTLELMAQTLAKQSGISIEDIEKCTFCGNTTMTLILADMTTDGMAAYPFTPEKTPEMAFEFRVGGKSVPSVILPGISGHIGGDITAAVLASGIGDTDKDIENSMLLDLGTNGEVICLLDGKLYGFSAAAGPAFEGASISSGMSATKGAVSEFSISENEVNCRVINSGKALGICGTGIMSAVENMLASGLLDVHGNLISWDNYKRFHPYSSIGDRIKDDEFILIKGSPDQPEITITQEDIRQLQLAKAAILAGMNTLFKYVGKDPEAVEKVFLAGGFSVIPSETLNALNIFPFAVGDNLSCIGNGALTGAAMVLLSDEEREKAAGLSDRVFRIELGTSDDFQEEFINSFDFV